MNQDLEIDARDIVLNLKMRSKELVCSKFFSPAEWELLGTMEYRILNGKEAEDTGHNTDSYIKAWIYVMQCNDIQARERQ